MNNHKEEVRKLLLSATLQRLNLINWSKSYTKITRYEAEEAKRFLEQPVLPEIFWQWHSKNQGVIYKILTPSMRKKYQILLINIKIGGN